MYRKHLLLFIAFVILVSIACMITGTEEVNRTPESAANQAFQEWVTKPYRNEQFKAIQNDGTFATVKVTVEFRESTEAEWEEWESDLECRKVGEKWQCDQDFTFYQISSPEPTPTSNGQNQVQVISTPTLITNSRGLESRIEGRITFESTRDGNEDIYVMDFDGSNIVRLTNDEGRDLQPKWSPGGTHIAFTSCRDDCYEIYVMKADGSEQTRLTYTGNDREQNYSPNWSPDGTRIAYTHSNVYINSNIFLMYADGTGSTQLTHYYGAFADSPNWSPDGTKIIYSLFNSGIYVINIDGSGQARLTSGPYNREASWSPDGSKIIYISDCYKTREIYVMNADGSNQTHLTNNEESEGMPAWSPDGTKIAFSIYHEENEENVIYTMNADGTEQTQLTMGSSPSVLVYAKEIETKPWTLLPIDFYVESEGGGWTNYAVELAVENGSYWLYLSNFQSLPVSSGVVHTEQGVDYPASVMTCDNRGGDEHWSEPYCYGENEIILGAPIPPYFRVKGVAPHGVFTESRLLLRFQAASNATPISVELFGHGTINLKEISTPQFPVNGSDELNSYGFEETITIPGGVELTFKNLSKIEGGISVTASVHNPDLYYQSAAVPFTNGYIISDSGMIVEVDRWSPSGGFSFDGGLGPGMAYETIWNFYLSDLGESGSMQYIIVQSGDFHPFLVQFNVP